MRASSLCAIAFVAAALAVAVALPVAEDTVFSSEEYEVLFDKFTTQFSKSYKSEEAAAKFDAFKFNLDFVSRHNQEHAQGKHTYDVEMNEFADMSLAEFRKYRLGYNYEARNSTQNTVLLSGAAPTDIDWRTKGAVTPVKNQGQCGSCWSFSATGSIEGANFQKTGKLEALSEQELMDCDSVDSACQGGLMDNAFKWVIQNSGIDSESDYPYKAHKSFLGCEHSKKAKHVGTVSAFTDVTVNSEPQLELAVAQQPVSVAIEADQSGFQLYKSGIFSGACGTNLDHGVLVVGYGVEATVNYWIVKNSWAATWGDAGYIRIAKDVTQVGGQCGIAMAASFPTA